MKTPKQIYQGALAIISNPETFTQGTYARDETGDTVPPASRSAVCWCSMGAIAKIAGDDPTNVDYVDGLAKPRWSANARSVLNALHGGIGGCPVSSRNDGSSHDDVVKWWKDTGKAKGWLS